MELNKKYRLFLVILLRIVSVFALCYCSLLYYELYLISKEEKPIQYTIRSSEEIIRPKSQYALMQIEFYKKEYKVEVQLDEYYKCINRNEKPTLYFSKKRDFVFAKRRINQFRAWAILSGIALLVSFIPFKSISKKMDEDIKNKYR